MIVLNHSTSMYSVIPTHITRITLIETILDRNLEVDVCQKDKYDKWTNHEDLKEKQIDKQEKVSLVHV